MKNITENYLEKIPVRSDKLCWKTDDEGLITLEIQNKGFFNRLFQLILKKPKVSYIHLDEFGSFVWSIINGEKNIMDLGYDVEEKFGEKSHPLYQRLSKYFGILESYSFITFR